MNPFTSPLLSVTPEKRDVPSVATLPEIVPRLGLDSALIMPVWLSLDCPEILPDDSMSAVSSNAVGIEKKRFACELFLSSCWQWYTPTRQKIIPNVAAKDIPSQVILFRNPVGAAGGAGGASCIL